VGGGGEPGKAESEALKVGKKTSGWVGKGGEKSCGLPEVISRWGPSRTEKEGEFEEEGYRGVSFLPGRNWPRSTDGGGESPG